MRGGFLTLVNGNRVTGSVILAALLLLTACKGGQPLAVTGAENSGTGSTVATASTTSPAASPWTTLGTRQTPSAPEQAITANAAAKWVDYNPPALYPKTIALPMQYISMSDGVQLAAYVTLPADVSGKAVSEPLPTILVQTSYNSGAAGFLGSVGSALGGADPYMVKHGYATVVVDVRGTGQSGGIWEAFGAREQKDYGEVVQWVATQPWFDGSIGVYGVSYLGITAIITAAQNHPEVKAAFPIVPIGDGYRDIVFTGGEFNPTFIPFWLTLVTALGVTDPCLLTDPATCLPTVLSHLQGALTGFQVPTVVNGVTGNAKVAYDDPAPDSFWATRSPLEHDGQITVPTFIVGGLNDLFQRSEPLSYAAIKNQATAKLLIGPWNHLQAALGDGLPADGVPPLNHIELMWFDEYLKGMDVGADKLPNVTQYVSGYGHYVTATDWPNPAASAERLYLHGNKHLSAEVPKAGEASNVVVNIPVEGLCSRSASQWTAGILGYIPLPCWTSNNIVDLWGVAYETASMPADYYINGPIEADIWISSTAIDANLSVRVSDVGPDGNATALTNGVLLASMRAVDASRSRTLDGEMIQPWHPFTKASVQALKANEPTLMQVEVFPTSALIKKGHKLRVTVSASNVAQALAPLPPLLNTLLSPATTIYSDAKHPSSVVLPVVPAEVLPPQ